MAQQIWIGGVGEIPQVDNYTLGGTIAAGSVFTVTINKKNVGYTAVTGDTATTAATALAAALNNSTYPEFQKVTWSSSGAVVIGTGDASGEPFTATVAASGSGSPTITGTTATSPSGPNWWNVANNWLTVGGASTVPATGDDVVIGRGSSILYGVDQSSVVLNSLTITQGFPATNTIGLPDTNTNGYAEYLKTRLKIGVTTGMIDTQSALVRLDVGTNAAAITVNGTGQGSSGTYPVDILCNNSSTSIVVNQGTVGVAANPGETSTAGSVLASFRSRQASDVTLTLGAGLTLTTFEQAGGTTTMNCGATTITHTAGTLTRFGSGAVGTWYDEGGTSDDYGTGTITNLYSSGVYSRRGLAPLTITNAQLLADGATNDPAGVITWTNPVEYIKCGPPAAQGDSLNAPPAVHYFNFGYGRKIQPVNV